VKRRKFFKDVGLGVGSGLIAPQLLSFAPDEEGFKYPGIQSLADATNDRDELALRLAFKNRGQKTYRTKVLLEVSGKAALSRTKWYFLESPAQITPGGGESPKRTTARNAESRPRAASKGVEPDTQNDSRDIDRSAELHPGDTDVLVAWLTNAVEASQITISYGKNTLRFTLAELLEKGELDKEGEHYLTVNFLGYSEVGKFDPSSLNIPDTDTFRLAVMADPQGGNAYEPYSGAPTRIKIHNAFIEDTVERINELDPQPTFTLILGDFVDDQGEAGHFQKMEELVQPLKTPVLLAVGNHESRYKANFTPAYNMSDLDNFFASQKRVNGMAKILYSFDLGQWHFVVWPDPLRKNFWMTHPHYFDWLEHDLEANKDRPVIFMHHVPIHPIGIDPLTTYVESATVKKTLVDILAKHGNVKYVFSGHVHIPLKASLKTAVSFRGMQMINLPAAGFRPRAFGESDFFGGPEQGVCVIDIKEEEAEVYFQHVTKEWYAYPKEFPSFDDKKYGLWFNEPWQLPLQPKIANGDFTNGLDHWHQRFVYHEDENPSNIRETRKAPDGQHTLYLYTRKRGYDVPGQDRLPQHINRVVQAVSIKNLMNPVLELSYNLHQGHYDPTDLNGFFVWLECYNGPHNVANLIYSPGKVYGSLTNAFGPKRASSDLHFDLPSETGVWHDVFLPIGMDFKSADKENRDFEQLGADRILIYLGTWTVNVGIGQEAGVFVREISLSSSTNGKETPPKNEKDIWHSKIDHIAGDHQFTEQDMVYPEGLRGVL